MCTYNGGKYLQEQLDSITQQTRLPDELIICDDDSTDGTICIIETFAASASFPVKLFENDKNIGSTKNFEQAIKLCSGDIIALADQDDVWHPDKLKLLEQIFLDSQQVGVVFTNGNVVSDNLSPLGYTLWDTFSFKRKGKAGFISGKEFEVLLNHNVVTGATMAFRSRLREMILPIPCTWVHDAWISIIISMNNRICFIDKCLIDYRQHDKQQYGGLNKNYVALVQRSRTVDDYQMQIQAYELLLSHIAQLKIESRDYCTKKITDKISHLKVRNLIYKSGVIDKIIKTSQELLNKRYYNYSNGCLSACKDIFM
jgi:glycosyltransferase involved in cell wall biosynthesis